MGCVWYFVVISRKFGARRNSVRAAERAEDEIKTRSPSLDFPARNCQFEDALLNCPAQFFPRFGPGFIARGAQTQHFAFLEIFLASKGVSVIPLSVQSTN